MAATLKTSKVSLYEFDKNAADYLTALIDELLQDQGIFAESFSYSIEVNITEKVGTND